MGSRQGTGRQRMLCLDQVPSLWQEREAACVASLYPSSHLKGQNGHKMWSGISFSIQKNKIFTQTTVRISVFTCM